MTRKDRPSQMAATKARWALSTAMGVSFPPRTFVSTPPAPRKLALTHLRRPIQPHALLLNNRRRPISKIRGRHEQARQSTTQTAGFLTAMALIPEQERRVPPAFAPTSRLSAPCAVSHSNPREETGATGLRWVHPRELHNHEKISRPRLLGTSSSSATRRDASG